MVAAAPHIDARLLAALARLLRAGHSIAESHRRLGEIAERLGLYRPSYEQTRVLAHALKAGKRDPGVGQTLLDVTFRVRPPEAILDLLE